MALARRFCASGFLPDVRRFGATYANYVGKPLTYVMATPERPDDADNPLRLVFGNEAAERDIEAFGRRFGCLVVDSYSSTENAVIVQRTPDMPAGVLGRPLPGVKVLDPVTGEEVPVARAGRGRRLLNADEAIGELVNTDGAGFFAGYYNDPAADAERMRGACTGPATSPTATPRASCTSRGAPPSGCGSTARTSPSRRSSGAAAPPGRAPGGGVRRPGRQRRRRPGDGGPRAAPGRSFDPTGFERFLDEQPDLGVKSRPRHVRIAVSLPQTATNKILKRALKEQGVHDHGTRCGPGRRSLGPREVSRPRR